jgi:hypothetical protein
MPEKIRLGYFSEDTQDLLRILGAHGVRYLIVGGEAVIFYGHARLTGDIDIFYDPKAENAVKPYAALIDFINSIDGVEFEECRSGRTMVDVDSPTGVMRIP